MRDNIVHEQKEHLKIEDKKSTLNGEEKEQLWKYMLKGKEVMHDNPDDELKKFLKIEDKKKKKANREKLNVDEKEQWRK